MLDTNMKTFEGKPCRACGSVLRYHSNKKCVTCLRKREHTPTTKATKLRYRLSEHGRAKNLEYVKTNQRWFKYGITNQTFAMMLEAQNHGCAICKTPLHSPHVDHNHQTGTVRGLLCRSCNFVLGHAKDDSQILRNAALYLESSF